MEQVVSEESLHRLSPLVLGGAGFSYQLHPKPESLPVVDIVKKAFDSGIRAIDTSPYYEPSEQLLGAVLSSHAITSAYARHDYFLMTKVGRIAADHFDYSPEWIRKSVRRSLDRFGTTYLDVVFCHDVEFVSTSAAVQAVGVLFELARAGAIHYVGISGYDISVLINVAKEAKVKYGRSVDIVQNWAQLTLQNTRLEQHGFAAFRQAGVKAVCCSSPLAVGLLRSEGVPIGTLGNWHPAPPDLRSRAQMAAAWADSQCEVLSSLALRFAIARAQQNSTTDMLVTTITGISSISELEDNIQSAKTILGKRDFKRSQSSDSSPPYLGALSLDIVRKDTALWNHVRQILGPWVDYDFSKPSVSGKL